VADWLTADVVTMNQAPDLEMLTQRRLIAADRRKRFPDDAAPYSTTTVFPVRAGDPKQIRRWADLAKPGTSVNIPSPRTSASGRISYMPASGSVVATAGGEAAARDFVAKRLANVPVLDGGGRGASTTLTRPGIGDVLVTFEVEAEPIAKAVGVGRFDAVDPSLSIEAPAPVAVNEEVAARWGTREVAQAYLAVLGSPAAQEAIAAQYFPGRAMSRGGEEAHQAASPDRDLHRRIAARRLAGGVQGACRRRRHLRPGGRAALSGRRCRPCLRPVARALPPPHAGASRAGCCRASGWRWA
jgi:sulfate/thiosulfate transport system substrate-binding protein